MNNRPLKVYSALIGFLGIVLFFIGAFGIFSDLKDGKYYKLVSDLFLFGISATLLYTAYENIWEISRSSISNISGITGVLFYLAGNYIFGKYFQNQSGFSLSLIYSLAPIVIGILVYKVMNAKLAGAARQ